MGVYHGSVGDGDWALGVKWNYLFLGLIWVFFAWPLPLVLP